MLLHPPIRARLAERFLFNFRMPLEAISKYMPESWLTPQVINGYGVASFCILHLRNITYAPLPTVFGVQSLSSAPRVAVIDQSKGRRDPAVFVTYRQTNSLFGAWYTKGWSAPHPLVESAIEHVSEAEAKVSIHSLHGELQFAATVCPAARLESTLFASTDAFSAFIAQGVSSYGYSRYSRRLTKFDLHKQDMGYSALEAIGVSGSAIESWLSDGAVLDSAFHTRGGQYEWTYHGLTAKERASLIAATNVSICAREIREG
jgi:hypothetical protein